MNIKRKGLQEKAFARVSKQKGWERVAAEKAFE
jgi:hypothetical protein